MPVPKTGETFVCCSSMHSTARHSTAQHSTCLAMPSNHDAVRQAGRHTYRWLHSQPALNLRSLGMLGNMNLSKACKHQGGTQWKRRVFGSAGLTRRNAWHALCICRVWLCVCAAALHALSAYALQCMASLTRKVASHAEKAARSAASPTSTPFFTRLRLLQRAAHCFKLAGQCTAPCCTS